uniref:Uncharacterized protein n=1 Tax=Cacopsylla melanoneura TaxID=428564 RepID=A0A8D8VY01_9HEMI
MMYLLTESNPNVRPYKNQPLSQILYLIKPVTPGKVADIGPSQRLSEKEVNVVCPRFHSSYLLAAAASMGIYTGVFGSLALVWILYTTLSTLAASSGLVSILLL